MVYFLKNYEWEQIHSFLLTWILIKFSWVAGREVSSASKLKFAHNLWTLCCHSFWCVVLTRIPLLIIYILVKFIIMKVSPLLPIHIFLPNFCHAFLLPQYLGLEQIQGMHTSVCCICQYYPSHSSFCGGKNDSRGPLRTNRALNNTNGRKTLPTTHRNYVERHRLSTIMLVFSHSSYLMSLLNRLLIWNLLNCLRFMKK